jgi:hypothetical protein
MKQALQLIKNSSCIAPSTSWKDIERYIQITIKDNMYRIICIPQTAYKNIKSKYISDNKYTSDDIDPLIALGIIGWTIWTFMDMIRDKHENTLVLNNDHDYIAIYSILRPVIDKITYKYLPHNKKSDSILRKICYMEYANSNFCTIETKHQYILKSIGIAIPMLIFLIKIGASKKDIQSCYRYFYHFIGARQLSDDAYDWREDMKNSQRTLVTEWLEKDIGKNRSVREYRKSFNRTVSPRVARTILKHAKTSMRYARKISCFTSTEFLEELPRFYEEMAQKILAKYAENKLRA